MATKRRTRKSPFAGTTLFFRGPAKVWPQTHKSFVVWGFPNSGTSFPRLTDRRCLQIHTIWRLLSQKQSGTTAFRYLPTIVFSCNSTFLLWCFILDFYHTTSPSRSYNLTLPNFPPTKKTLSNIRPQFNTIIHHQKRNIPHSITYLQQQAQTTNHQILTRRHLPRTNCPSRPKNNNHNKNEPFQWILHRWG